MPQLAVCELCLGLRIEVPKVLTRNCLQTDMTAFVFALVKDHIVEKSELITIILEQINC